MPKLFPGGYTPVDTGAVVPPGPVDPSLREQIEQRLTEMIPAGHKFAILACVRVDDGTPVGQFGFAERFPHGWSVTADIEKRWGGPIEGKVMALWSK